VNRTPYVWTMAVLLAFGLLCEATAADVPSKFRLPNNVKSQRDKLARLDAELKAAQDAYFKDQSNSNERKLTRLNEKREEYIGKLNDLIARALEPFDKDLLKLEGKQNKVYERMERADERRQEKLQAEADKIEAEIAEIKAEKKFILQAGQVGDVMSEDGGLKRELITELPTFNDGPWDGYHLGFSAPTFNVYMTGEGKLYVQPVENKEPVGNPIQFGWPNARYWHPRKKHTIGRRIVGFTKASDVPLLNPKKVELRGFFEDDVAFVVEYEFSQTDVEVTGGYRDSPLVAYPTVYRISTYIAKSHDISPKAEMEERQEILKGCLLRVHEIEGRRTNKVKYPYSEIAHFRHAVEGGEARGAWGARQLFIRSKNTENRFRAWIYDNFCPWQGYRFYYYAKDNELERYKARYSIAIR
jgi:hypothetical protein